MFDRFLFALHIAIDLVAAAAVVAVIGVICLVLA